MANYCTDSFTDTDTTTLDAHTPESGGVWDVRGTDLTISSNQLIGVSFGSNTAINDVVPASDDYQVSARLYFNVDSGTERGGLRIRDTGVNNGYSALYDAGSDEWQLIKDTFTSLDSVADATFGAGDDRLLVLRAIGTTISVSVDGTEIISVTDATNTTGFGGVEIHGDGSNGFSLDAFSIDDATTDPPPGTHIVSGRGNVAIDTTTEWLSTAIVGRPDQLSNGAAEPPNWYHQGMLSWGTSANGAMTSYPVTRDLDLVRIPLGMDTLWYQFTSGITATIVELTAP